MSLDRIVSDDPFVMKKTELEIAIMAFPVDSPIRASYTHIQEHIRTNPLLINQEKLANIHAKRERILDRMEAAMLDIGKNK